MKLGYPHIQGVAKDLGQIFFPGLSGELVTNSMNETNFLATTLLFKEMPN